MLPAQLESLHDLARASDDIAPDHRDAAEAALAEIDTLTQEVARWRHILDAPVTALFANGREPTTNERHLLNLLSWRQAERNDAALALVEMTAEVDRLSREVARQREAIRTASGCLSAVADAITHEEVREALRNLVAALST